MASLDISPLNNKKILVTGCSGHLGMAMVDKLVQQGIYPTLLIHRNNEKIASLAQQFQLPIVPVDLRNKIELLQYPELAQMDIVLHLAAHVPQRVTEDEWEKALNTNVQGTMNLCSIMKPGSKFIFASTCEVYGLPQTPLMTEEHQVQPLSFYGASKVAAELALQVFAKKKNIPLTILRFSSIYGPGETIERALPNFIHAALNGENLIIYGDGSDRRDFLYLDDAANYCLAAMINGKETIYNVASGQSYTLLDLAQKVIALSPHKVGITFAERKKPKTDYIFDLSKVRNDLGYFPVTSLEHGLRQEINWFREMKEKNFRTINTPKNC